MTAEKIIMLALCVALYAMFVAVVLTKHREDRGGGIKPTTREVLRPTSAPPPPPKKREKGAGE